MILRCIHLLVCLYDYYKKKLKELVYTNETRWLNVKEMMIKLGLLCVCLEASSGEPTHTQILTAIEQTTPRKSV